MEAKATNLTITKPCSVTTKQEESNSTNYGEGTEEDVQSVWLLCEIASVTCGIISFYLLICVAIFVERKRRFPAKQVGSGRLANKLFVSMPISALSENGILTPNRQEKESRYDRRPRTRNYQKSKSNASRCMHITLLITVLFSFLRAVEEQALFFYGGLSDFACNILTKVMISLTALCIHGCLVFLWLRQLAFYTNPLLRKIRPKFLTVISYGTYAEMVITVITALVLHLWWREYISMYHVCISSVASEKVSIYVPFGVMVISTVTIQLSLTFLFVYPIVCHNIQMKKRSSQRDERLRELHSNRSKSTDKLIKCVKRALLGGTIGISTDTVGALISMWLLKDEPLFVLSVLYQMDILLNIFCLLYTYVDWRQIVFPWLKQGRAMKDNATLTGAAKESEVKFTGEAV